MAVTPNSGHFPRRRDCHAPRAVTGWGKWGRMSLNNSLDTSCVGFRSPACLLPAGGGSSKRSTYLVRPMRFDQIGKAQAQRLDTYPRPKRAKSRGNSICVLPLATNRTTLSAGAGNSAVCRSVLGVFSSRLIGFPLIDVFCGNISTGGLRFFGLPIKVKGTATT